MKHRIGLLLVLVLSLMLLSQPQPASAATLTGGFTSPVSCTNFTTTLGTLTTTRDNTGAGQEAYYYEVRDGAGTLLSRWPSSGTYTYPYPSVNAYGFGAVLGYTTPPAYNPITVRWISPAGNGQLEQIFYENTGSCAGLPTYEGLKPPGPAIPGGFVLRVITCDVAVFSAAAGTPTGASIKAGQTWFVNPAPVKVTGSAYDSWTEIFVSGSPNGFIPTVCVGGYPPDAPAGGK